MFERPLAFAICLSAATGIGLELTTLIRAGSSIIEASWTLALYFTILTNGLIAVLFGIVTVKGSLSGYPRLIAGSVAAIVMVGVVFALLLQDVRTLAGATATANFLLHQLNPVLAAGYWLTFAPKGKLSWRDPLLWSLYPLAYLVYALTRGSAEGRYPYPFIDVEANGWTAVLATSIAIAVGFVAAAEIMVLLDRALARRKR